MNLALVTAPTKQPVTLERVKRHLRIPIDSNAEDAALDMILDSAVSQVERDKGIKLVTQTWDYKLSGFPAGDTIRIPHPPLQSVTSITYVDTDGDTQTLSADNYDVHTGTLPGEVTLAYNETWPTTREQAAAVTIRFVCGYTGSGVTDYPKNLIHAILMAVGTGDQFRENMAMVSRGQEPVSLAGQGSYDRLIGAKVEFY